MSQAVFGWLLAGAIPALGILYYWQQKWNVRREFSLDTFDSFFLGGANVGQFLTRNSNWGLCFAFANAVWYYAFLGYTYGPWVFLLQIPWSASIVGLALLLRRYMAATSEGTVHGFIGRNFGANASLMAAIATLSGYTLNVGFEIFYSAHLIARSFDVVYGEVLIALLIALFVGAYCVAGGYRASVITDPMQNRLGVVALIILIAALVPSLARLPGGWEHSLAHQQYTEVPWHFVVGVGVFTFFFNLVDMANWQSIAANRDAPEDKIPAVRNGFYQSAAVQMIAPALLGVLLGVALKSIKGGLEDDSYFRFAFGRIFEPMSMWHGLLLGVVMLGFISVTVSSAGSYLVAAMQTFAVDVFKRKQYAEYATLPERDERRRIIEENILDWVKRAAIPVVLFMTLAFAGLYYGLDVVKKQGLAFQFQFVMYGAAVTLVPAVLSRLFRSSDPPAERSSVTGAGFWSIFVGLVFVLVPFGVAGFIWSEPWMVAARASLPSWFTSEMVINLTPATGLVFACLTFFFVERAGGRR